MKKRIAALLLSTVMAFSLTACGNSAKTEKADNKETKQTTEAVEDMSFDEMVDAAKGTTVTFYGWGGDDSLNDWLDNYYAPRLKEKYDISKVQAHRDVCSTSCPGKNFPFEEIAGTKASNTETCSCSDQKTFRKRLGTQTAERM